MHSVLLKPGSGRGREGVLPEAATSLINTGDVLTVDGDLGICAPQRGDRSYGQCVDHQKALIACRAIRAVGKFIFP